MNTAMTSEGRPGVELATGRPLFPIVALRVMGYLAKPDTSWATPDDEYLDNETMLVMLWKKATTDYDGENMDKFANRFCNDRRGEVRAVALLAEAALEYLEEPIREWWEACGEEDDAKAVITTALALGVREATQAVEIGRIAAGAVIHLLEDDVDEAWPVPKVETEASWSIKMAAT